MEFESIIIPVVHDGSCTVYECYLLNKKDFRARLMVADEKDLSSAELECDWKLQQHLSSHSGIIKQMLAKNLDVQGFFQEFISFVTNVVREELRLEDGVLKNTTCSMSHIFSQMETVGWDKLDSTDPEFHWVNLKLCDAKGRPHILHINLNGDLSNANAVCIVDLPIKSDFHINPEKQLSLQDLLNQFSDMLRRCEDFWDMMSEIDNNTWVLEPEKPGPSVTHRRIALDTNVSFQFKVDPRYPRMVTECRFLGADQKIASLKEKLNRNLHKWNVDSTILENLHNMLDMTFPSPADSSKENFSVECGICYSYRLDNQIPDKVCDDERCGQAFHQDCLYEWLRALPSSRQSFNMIFGECPFCSKPMTVKMRTS